MRTNLFLTILTSVLFFSSCKDNVNNPIGNQSEKYPTAVGNEWEYVTFIYLGYYDSTGNIINTDTIFVDTAIIKISSTSDSIPGYKNLVKFNYYNKYVNHPFNNNSYAWYLNNDTSLTAVAYQNPGTTSPIQPVKKLSRYMTIKELLSLVKTISLFPSANDDGIYKMLDTIQYYEIPRKALSYPLSVNKRWVELYIPFYRERFVQGTGKYQFNGNMVDCFVINGTFMKLEMLDYISMKYGMVKRTVLGDSLMITNEFGDPMGFGRTQTVSELIRTSIK